MSVKWPFQKPGKSFGHYLFYFQAKSNNSLFTYLSSHLYFYSSTCQPKRIFLLFTRKQTYFSISLKYVVKTLVCCFTKTLFFNSKIIKENLCTRLRNWGEVQRFPIYPCFHTHCTTSPIINISHQRNTFIETGEPTSISQLPKIYNLKHGSLSVL